MRRAVGNWVGLTNDDKLSSFCAFYYAVCPQCGERSLHTSALGEPVTGLIFRCGSDLPSTSYDIGNGERGIYTRCKGE